MSLEIFDGELSAASWAEAHGDALTEAALAGGARNWSWHSHDWGVIFEVEFDDEAAWERFVESTAVKAALDAVPEPVNGLLIYRGRGGSSSRPVPRRPRPLAGAGAGLRGVPPRASGGAGGAASGPPGPGVAAPVRHRRDQRHGVRGAAIAGCRVTAPVQILVIGFDPPAFSGEVLTELARLREAGI